MAKEKVSEWSSTPGSNTEISGINISEGCAPSGINDAIREMMAQIKDWQSGESGDPSVLSQGVMSDLASAATTDIGLQNTNFLRITGNTTITSFGTNYKGPRFLVFEGAVTLTHSSTLVLPGGANITTAAGDVLIAIPGATLGTADKWIVTSYQKANTSPGYANIPGGFGFRNRIINGDMRIDQRNAGASVTGNNNAYALDRWIFLAAQSGKVTLQQNQGGATPPVGFKSYYGATSSSAYSVLSTDNFSIAQWIEGYNIADLEFGTANAKTVTLSFWVRSSLTGTFGGTVAGYNGSAFRSCPFAYTISVANIWEQKTVTIPGDTTTFAYSSTNGYGLFVSVSLGAGSAVSATAGTWASGLNYAPTGATSVVGTNGATFYITGVQLEAGTVATPFERRDYGRELMMCQRYFQLSKAAAFVSSSTQTTVTMFYKTTMRSTPTFTRITNWSSTGETGTTVSLSDDQQANLFNAANAVGGIYTLSAEL